MNSNGYSVLVVGGSGFVGGAVCEALNTSGNQALAVAAPRIAADFGRHPADAADEWQRTHPDEFGALVAAASGTSAVVNAAGLASPTSPRSPELWGANAILPIILARASQSAGIARFVHVSSAAVQGSKPCLDESPFVRGHSAYAESKGAGEAGVADAVRAGTTSCVIYRPTSVLGAARPIARRLAQVLRSRWLFLPRGDRPLPVAHVEHVGQAVAFLTTASDVPTIVLHPWEQMTVCSLASAFGRSAPIRMVPNLVGAPLAHAVGLLAKGGPIAGQARRIELLWSGQEQRSSMAELGFVLADPSAAFRRLGSELLVDSPT